MFHSRPKHRFQAILRKRLAEQKESVIYSDAVDPFDALISDTSAADLSFSRPKQHPLALQRKDFTDGVFVPYADSVDPFDALTSDTSIADRVNIQVHDPVIPDSFHSFTHPQIDKIARERAVLRAVRREERIQLYVTHIRALNEKLKLTVARHADIAGVEHLVLSSEQAIRSAAECVDRYFCGVFCPVIGAGEMEMWRAAEYPPLKYFQVVLGVLKKQAGVN